MSETQMKMVCFYECVDKQYDDETSNDNNNNVWKKKTIRNEINVLVVEIVSLVNGILFVHDAIQKCNAFV